MSRFGEVRLCERCWTVIPAGRACLVGRHPDPAYSLRATPRSYRHLYGDPACTGSQAGPEPPIGMPGGAAAG